MKKSTKESLRLILEDLLKFCILRFLR